MDTGPGSDMENEEAEGQDRVSSGQGNTHPHVYTSVHGHAHTHMRTHTGTTDVGVGLEENTCSEGGASAGPLSQKLSPGAALGSGPGLVRGHPESWATGNTMDLEVPSPGGQSLEPGQLWAHDEARLDGHRLPLVTSLLPPEPSYLSPQAPRRGHTGAQRWPGQNRRLVQTRPIHRDSHYPSWLSLN